MSVTLFDNTVVRKAGWLGPMETSFAFLNRSARPEETQMRHLWNHGSASTRPIVASILPYGTLPLRQVDHVAAFFEIYAIALLHRDRFAIKIEPCTVRCPPR